MKNILSALILALMLGTASHAQTTDPQISLYPVNWWVGMKNHNLQLMVHAKDVAAGTVRLSYPGVRLSKVNKVENPNYLFLDLTIDASAKAGPVPIVFSG